MLVFLLALSLKDLYCALSKLGLKIFKLRNAYLTTKCAKIPMIHTGKKFKLCQFQRTIKFLVNIVWCLTSDGGPVDARKNWKFMQWRTLLVFEKLLMGGSKS